MRVTFFLISGVIYPPTSTPATSASVHNQSNVFRINTAICSVIHSSRETGSSMRKPTTKTVCHGTGTRSYQSPRSLMINVTTTTVEGIDKKTTWVCFVYPVVTAGPESRVIDRLTRCLEFSFHSKIAPALKALKFSKHFALCGSSRSGWFKRHLFRIFVSLYIQRSGCAVNR